MTLSMYAASAPVFIRMLANLERILDKGAADAEARKIDPAVLLQSRLSPTMFALSRQVQVACDFAKNTCSRLAGAEPPKFPDDEKTFDDLKARIAKTIAHVKAFTPDEIDGSETREITLPIGGQTMTFRGEAFLLTIGMPNFYFHVTTAYAILRHNGVDLGKRDFLGAA